jgi:hypothetical protein
MQYDFVKICAELSKENYKSFFNVESPEKQPTIEFKALCPLELLRTSLRSEMKNRKNEEVILKPISRKVKA